MYGKGPIEFPERIICLTAETAEIVYALLDVSFDGERPYGWRRNKTVNLRAWSSSLWTPGRNQRLRRVV